MDNLINVLIDGKPIAVPAGTNVLKAADMAGVKIPRLCFLETIHEEGNCRICVVKIEGQKGLKPSCRTIVSEGMVITTDNKEIYDAVSTNLEMLVANHKFECWKCSRETSCEFLDLIRRFSVDNRFSEEGFKHKTNRLNDTSKAIVIDSSKCVLCGRCVSACEKYTGLGILNFNQRQRPMSGLPSSIIWKIPVAFIVANVSSRVRLAQSAKKMTLKFLNGFSAISRKPLSSKWLPPSALPLAKNSVIRLVPTSKDKCSPLCVSLASTKSLIPTSLPTSRY
jgi:predicted molibdopterin-dependent oxidoreductase YjgC